MTSITTVKYEDVDLEVYYEVSEYEPETRYEPACPSELEIISVHVAGIDVTLLLSDSVFNHLQKELESMVEAGQEVDPEDWAGMSFHQRCQHNRNRKRFNFAA